MAAGRVPAVLIGSIDTPEDRNAVDAPARGPRENEFRRLIGTAYAAVIGGTAYPAHRGPWYGSER
ncbi:hypothetical protein GCM10020227_27080 [Streptomyces flavovirens]